MNPRKVVASLLLAAAAATYPVTAGPPPEILVQSGALTAVVGLDPFQISFEQPGATPLAGLDGSSLSPADPSARYGTLAFAVDVRAQAQPPELGYGVFAAVPLRWFHATKATTNGFDGDALTLDVETDDPLGRVFRVVVAPAGEGVVSIAATLDRTAGVSATGWSFAIRARRAVPRLRRAIRRSRSNRPRGRILERRRTVLQPARFTQQLDPIVGERFQGPPPIPGTNFSMPWLVSSRGYGFLLDSTYPNRFRLGTDREDAWNVETQEPAFHARVFAGPTPAETIRRFGAATGLQPDPAPWFFGPWYQPTGSAELREQLLSGWRSWDVPVTVAQTYTHYLPCGAHLGRSRRPARAGRRLSRPGLHDHDLRELVRLPEPSRRRVPRGRPRRILREDARWARPIRSHTPHRTSTPSRRGPRSSTSRTRTRPRGGKV